MLDLFKTREEQGPERERKIRIKEYSVVIFILFSTFTWELWPETGRAKKSSAISSFRKIVYEVIF